MGIDRPQSTKVEVESAPDYYLRGRSARLPRLSQRETAMDYLAPIQFYLVGFAALPKGDSHVEDRHPLTIVSRRIPV
jgi:hypothetical protein